MSGRVHGSAARQRLAGLIQSMADSKYLLGRKLAELGPGAPTLEAATAACALAQSELGHARLLYRLAAELRGEAAGSWREDGPEPQVESAFPFIAEVGTHWVEFICALYASNAAISVLLDEVLTAAPDLSRSLAKLRPEQKDQILYAEGWLQTLAQERGRIPAGVVASLAAMVPVAEQWLAAAEADGLLRREGLLPAAGANLAQTFRRRAEALAAAAGLALPV